jgi:hypothetical protein
VLWVIGSAVGGRLGAGYRGLASSGAAPDPATPAMNAALLVTLLAILIDMIYKPGGPSSSARTAGTSRCSFTSAAPSPSWPR